MKIPLRIIEKEVFSSKEKFSFWGGVRNVFKNFRRLFTTNLISGGDIWYVRSEESKIINDICLIVENGQPKFILTPEGAHSVALEIEQDITKSP